MLDIAPKATTEGNQEQYNTQSVKSGEFELSKKVTPEEKNTTEKDARNSLLENDDYSFLEEKQDNGKMLFTFTMVVLFIVAGFWIYLYFVKTNTQSQLDSLNVQFDELEQQMASPELVAINDTATRLSGGIASLNKLVNGQILFSNLFAELDKKIPDYAQVQNISIDEDLNMTFVANTKSLDESAILVKSLSQSDFFNNIILTGDAQSQSAGEQNYTVSLSMIINEGLLQTNSQESQ